MKLIYQNIEKPPFWKMVKQKNMGLVVTPTIPLNETTSTSPAFIGRSKYICPK